MDQILQELLPYTAAISTILGVAALGLILNLSKHMHDVYAERVQAINERTKVLEERLKAKDERIEELNSKVTKVGASLGIAEFQEQLSGGVRIGDIGENFSGKIAGRDIVDTLNDLSRRVDNSLNHLIDQSDKYYTLSRENGVEYEFTIDFVFGRRQDDLRRELEQKTQQYQRQGWSLHSITSDYNVFDGCLLLFRRRSSESIP
jgi:hypothetical protein